MVYSRSTHSLIATDTFHCIGPPAVAMCMAWPHRGVTNGDRIPSIKVYVAMPITIGGKEFSINLFVLPLINYELVLAS